MRLQGKRALVTGASQGFGLAVARAFVAEGASLAICARTKSDIVVAQQELAREAPGGVRVVAREADVSCVDDVHALVNQCVEELGGVDVLVCNAGVYGPKGSFDEVEWTDWERAFTVNVYGTLLVCREVLPRMKAQRGGKIILLSGGGATKPLPMLSAYAASKAAVVRFGETVAEEVREFGIQVNSVAPGALNTRLLKEVLDAGPERVGRDFYRQSLEQQAKGGTPLERGADLCVFLASSASDAITGKLISAVWDPWDKLDERAADLQSTDIYTLRRIMPRDRGKNWG